MRFFIYFFLIFSGNFCLIAQDDVVPSTFEEPSSSEAPSSSEKKEDDPVLAEKLKGVIFLKDSTEVIPHLTDVVEGIQAKEIELLQSEAFKEKFTPFQGKPLTKKILYDLCREVILYYRSNNKPIVNVVIPEEQDFTSGVVQILVIEGYIGKVKVTGAKWMDPSVLGNQIRLRPGEPLLEDRLLSEIAWLNINPFRRVEPVITPGERPGEADVVLKITDRFPVRFFTGYEDSGNALTGDSRWFAGFQSGSTYLLDQQLSYQFTGNTDLTKVTAHSANWTAPLPWHHTVSFFGNYAEVQADTANTGLDSLKGKSWQASARYTIPLEHLLKYNHQIVAGFDFKQSNSNLEFGGSTVNVTTEIAQFMTSYEANFRDNWGNTSFQLAGYGSPGHLTGRNNNSTFDRFRRFAKSEYFYSRFILERVTSLPYHFNLVTRGTVQQADVNLLTSEQLGLGGYDTVRGYDEREANGDEGYLVKMELRAPPFSFGQATEWGWFKKATDQLQFLAFWDYGMVENRHLFDGEDPHVQLASVGPGLRYSISPYLTVRFDYGFQLYETGISRNRRDNSRAHLGIVFSY